GRALVQLDVLVAALQRTRRDALHVLDIALILDQRGVGLDALPPGAAEQFRHRDAFELAADVPQRDVEAADRVYDDAGAAQSVQQALDAGRQFRVGRVLANRDAADDLDG